MEKMHWQDVVTLLAGIVLIGALWLLNVTPAEGQSLTFANWNFVVGGLLLAASGLAAILAFRLWEEIVTLILGVWMIGSPWLLGFSNIGSLTWIAVVCGLVVTIMSVTVMVQSADERSS